MPQFGEATTGLTEEDSGPITAILEAYTFRNREIRHDRALEVDVSNLLSQVKAPTLVIKSQKSLFTDLTQTRRLVNGIKGAQLRIVPGVMAPVIADLDAVVEAFVTVLGSEDLDSAAIVEEGLRTVVFTDLVSSTETMSRLGDQKGRAEIRRIERAVEELCVEYSGHLVKNLGDGSLISFRSTQKALAFGVALQQRAAKRTSRPEDRHVGR